MAAAQTLTVRELAPAEAAQALAGIEHLDPRGLTAADDLQHLTRSGRCFRLDAEGGARAVYVLTQRNGRAWVEAAAGSGPVDWTAALDVVASCQAEGLRSIGCQTARPGLVRKLRGRGWRVSGWIMTKELQ